MAKSWAPSVTACGRKSPQNTRNSKSNSAKTEYSKAEHPRKSGAQLFPFLQAAASALIKSFLSAESAQSSAAGIFNRPIPVAFRPIL
ncbi:MAG: hypothetical protein ACLVJH_12120 [Faecalibacterium prausnitzii]